MQKIPIIDNDRIVLQLLRNILSPEGRTLETAATPQRAVELTAQEKYDQV